MMNRIAILAAFLILHVVYAEAQNLTGSLQTRAQFFQRDSSIGAINTPQYDRQLYGAEAWVNLNYSNWGFDFKIRFDAFHNSNLFNPNGSLTGEGIGFWQVHRSLNNLDITAGYVYDQIGTGIIYRAFEDRTQLIDNALKGVRVNYSFNDNWQLRAFTGRQKQIFEEYAPVIKGIALDGYVSIDSGRVVLAPGIGAVNRTYDDATIQGVIATLQTYDSSNVFIPEYNTYAFSAFNRLTIGSFNWYIEGAYKPQDVQLDPQQGLLIGDAGTVFYSTLSYSQKGFAVSVEGKRTEAFDFRTRPEEPLNRGQIHFIPPLARENTYRLTTRYQPAVQFLGELGFQGTLLLSPSKKFNVELNYSYSDDLDGELLYREFYSQLKYKASRKTTLIGGLQMQRYNQERFEVKPGVPTVETIIPFVELQHRISRKKNIRFELQYMDTDEDLGSWVWGLVEYSVAPKWSFEVSDMYNIGLEVDPGNVDGLYQHYPTIGTTFTQGRNRYSLRYIKQVAGIVCSGGICRLEPAFSGVRFTLRSSF